MPIDNATNGEPLPIAARAGTVMEFRSGLSGLAIVAAIALASARELSGSAFAQVVCTPSEDACVTWSVSGPEISPDGRYLYFSYRYGSTSTEYSRNSIGRLSLEALEPEAVARSCDAEYEAPVFSPDGRWLAFVWTRGKGIWTPDELRRMPAAEYWRSSRQIAFLPTSEASLDQATYVADARRSGKFWPIFSKNSRYLYYVHNTALTATTITRYEMSSGKIEDVFGPSSQEEIYQRRHSPEYFYSIRKVEAVDLNGRPALLILARTPHDRSQLYPMVTAPRTTEDVRHHRYLYEFDPADRSLRLHQLNLKADLQAGDILTFVFRPPSTLVFARGGARSIPDSRLYAVDLAARELVLGHFADLSATAADFTVSPNGRWVAQTRQVLLTSATGRPSGAVTILSVTDRVSGQARDVDFGTAKAREALLHRCRRQPHPR